MYRRSVFAHLSGALDKYRSVIHILAGPRQVGKTTVAKQLLEMWSTARLYATADVVPPPGPEWIETQWARATIQAQDNAPCLLVLDEIQKVSGWSTVLKRLWDDKPPDTDIRVLCLGSSALLLQSGLAETMAGRFFKHDCYHWSFAECRDAFGWDLDEWMYFGGYPGTAVFKDNEEDWQRYVVDSLVETVISRDVLQMEPVRKPALLRHLFGLAAAYPAEILSYNKMLGQLQDAGNTTTLAHYLHLLGSAYLISGLERFSRRQDRKRGSSPKLVVWNNALVSAHQLRSFAALRADPAAWGRLVENACLAHMLMSKPQTATVTYWREGHFEVDAVVAAGEESGLLRSRVVAAVEPLACTNSGPSIQLHRRCLSVRTAFRWRSFSPRLWPCG